VDLVIEPDPEPQERDAVTLALARLLEAGSLPAPYRSRWRQAGIAANVGSDDGAPAE
jgi:hypothetical protein